MESKVKEVYTDGSLSRKTKKELIEIILRKDAREIELNQQISNLTKEVGDYSSRLNAAIKDVKGMEKELNQTRSALNSSRVDFECHCDDTATEICELKGIIKLYRLGIILMAIVSIVCIIIGYIE